MEQGKSSTLIGGVDVGKWRLDAAIEGIGQQLVTSNDAAGIAELAGWLIANRVGRVGIEATGGYERKLKAGLEAHGIEVVVHQPIEVKLYARISRQRNKTDATDARLIAAATAAIKRQPKPSDPILLELSERLTAYEQIADQLMTLRTFKDSLSLTELIHTFDAQIGQLVRLKASLARQLLAAIKASTTLNARFQLLTSLPGIGPIVAASLIVRMPELGQMQHGQPAALVGVAPHARDSGQWTGKRFIAGGRSRPRRMLYLAALAARRHDKALNAFANRLREAGKPPKLIIVAIMRKLIEAANIVLKRQTPWTKLPA